MKCHLNDYVTSFILSLKKHLEHHEESVSNAKAWIDASKP